MLDALYIKPNDVDGEDDNITFSIFEFKALPASKIALCRQHLFCPVCLQPAYFRRASSDGKQACFGSRHHLPDCSELNSPSRNNVSNSAVAATTPQHIEGQPANVELHSSEPELHSSEPGLHSSKPELHSSKAGKPADEQEPLPRAQHQATSPISEPENEDASFVIDFSAKTVVRKRANKTLNNADAQAANSTQKVRTTAITATEQGADSVIKQGLGTLLTSLLRGSSLATSDVWVYTSDTHKWRAKNLFVKLEDADVLENGAPRMYWGTISYADKEMMWLNVEGAKNIAIPLKLFQQKLIDKYALTQSSELKGARIILFAKCLANKDKSRKFLQLWSNDLQYVHLVLNN